MIRKLRDVGFDFYRQLPDDLKEASAMGGAFSIFGSIAIFLLVVFEFQDFLTTSHKMFVGMDEREDDLLFINLNISLHRLPCQQVSVDVEDLMGTHRMKLTSKIRKWRLLDEDTRLEEIVEPDVKKHLEIYHQGEQISTQLTLRTFVDFVRAHDIVLVNFYAPWCIWSQRLSGVWEQTALALKEEGYSETIKLAKVDCFQPTNRYLCNTQHVSAFPVIRVYEGRSTHSHRSYNGARSPEAIMDYIKKLLAEHLNYNANSGNGRASDEGAKEHIKGEAFFDSRSQNDIIEVAMEAKKRALAKGRPVAEGCLIQGHMMVRKVPGSTVLHAGAEGHSFDHSQVNTSHTVHSLTYGMPLEASKLMILPKSARLAMDSLARKTFPSTHSNTSHEHYVKVLSTDFRLETLDRVNAYKYQVLSNKFTVAHALEGPHIKFSYDLSPLTIQWIEQETPFFEFITSLFGLIGGTFTVFGLAHAVIEKLASGLEKKLD